MTADWQGKKRSTTGTCTLPMKNEDRKMRRRTESGRRPPARMNGLPEVEDRSKADIIDLDLEGSLAGSSMVTPSAGDQLLQIRADAHFHDLQTRYIPQPLPASDPCVAAVISHRRSRGEPVFYLEEAIIEWQLDHLREALHIKPIRKAGRPKGSVKRDTVELMNLWREGLSGQQICKQLGYPQESWQETWKVLYSRIRSTMRRLSKHKRLGVSKARRDARAARKLNRVKTL